MTDLIELDPNFSTTRRMIKSDPLQMVDVVKQSNKPEDKFETVGVYKIECGFVLL